MNLFASLATLLLIQADCTRGVAIHHPVVPPDSQGLSSLGSVGKVQHPLIAASEKQTQQRRVDLPLKQPFDYDLAYIFEVGVGTPRQHLSLKLDIASAQSYVHDVDLLRDGGRCPNLNFYNGEESSTSHSNGTREDTSFDYGFMDVSGEVVEDMICLGSSHPASARATFLNADLVRQNGISWDPQCYDGALGFAPFKPTQTPLLSPLFPTIIEQQQLEANLFALRLREPAYLSIGGVDESLFHGDILRVPLRNKTSEGDKMEQWQTRMNYVMIGSQREDPPVQHVLDGITTTFSTTSAFMYLPDMLVQDFLDSLEFEDEFMLPPSVDCTRRAHMPDVTFNLEGVNLTLTPYDYTLEWRWPDHPPRCVTAIFPIGLADPYHSQAVLGNAFLRAFYSVYDLDSYTIGFAQLARSDEQGPRSRT